jgi:hypothetical protein
MVWLVLQQTVPKNGFDEHTGRQEGQQPQHWMHVDAQTPPVHVSPAGQTFPQAPQLLTSVLVSTHVPLHKVRPDGQQAHMPLLQLRMRTQGSDEETSGEDPEIHPARYAPSGGRRVRTRNDHFIASANTVIAMA